MVYVVVDLPRLIQSRLIIVRDHWRLGSARVLDLNSTVNFDRLHGQRAICFESISAVLPKYDGLHAIRSRACMWWWDRHRSQFSKHDLVSRTWDEMPKAHRLTQIGTELLPNNHHSWSSSRYLQFWDMWTKNWRGWQNPTWYQENASGINHNLDMNTMMRCDIISEANRACEDRPAARGPGSWDIGEIRGEVVLGRYEWRVGWER